jgi:hypothetical protein
MVWAHYFPSYPPKITNEAALGTTGATTGDYYDRHHLSDTGEGGQYTTIGGFLRDRPLPLPAQTGTEATWRVALARAEIAQAKSAMLDGFAMEILGVSGQNWNWGNYMIAALEQENDPRFRWFWQPDGTASGTSTAAGLATALRTGLDSPVYFKLGTRPLVSPFGPEKAPNNTKTGQLTLWTDTKNNLLTGTPTYNIAYWGNYVNDWTTTGQAPTFNSLFEGRHGRWGSAVAYGEATFGSTFEWMQYVRSQDVRPKSSQYWEPWNTELFRACWMQAINNRAKIDQVLIPTWNDYSEHAHICWSRNHKKFWTKLNAYFVQWFKTGVEPITVRDTIFLNHRIMTTTNHTVTGTQTVWEANQSATTSPDHNDVEALVFCASPASVIISYNGVDQTAVSVPAGMTSVKKPLPTSGTVAARIVRGGVTAHSVTSDWTVVTSNRNQDLHLRGTVSR